MGVYNCECTLRESINSILNQTYKNWEFVICDDGSFDNSYNIVKEYESKYPDKFIVIRNDFNRGLNYTLNRCLKYATGKYIARMDGDDISLKERLYRQVKILNNNNNISFVSSNMIYFDESGDWGESKVIEEPKNKDFVSGTPFCHAPAMVRKEVYDAVGGYTNHKMLIRVEDYHLWFKIYSLGYKGYNIQEFLYKMRDDRKAIVRRKFKFRINEAYVKYIGFKMLKLEKKYYFNVFKPIFVGFLPNRLYVYLHKLKLKN
ncbi:TPA: glycosyltransferase [Clostridium perfringens]|nr:glycosyltransferase [Clostridium perfringens]